MEKLKGRVKPSLHMGLTQITRTNGHRWASQAQVLLATPAASERGRCEKVGAVTRENSDFQGRRKGFLGGEEKKSRESPSKRREGSKSIELSGGRSPSNRFCVRRKLGEGAR